MQKGTKYIRTMRILIRLLQNNLVLFYYILPLFIIQHSTVISLEFQKALDSYLSGGLRIRVET